MPSAAHPLSPDFSQWIAGSLLLTLRIAPTFSFAPPFTLVRLPAQFRLLFGLALAAMLAAANPATTSLADLSAGSFLAAAARELMLGTLFVLAFQLVFAALYFAGRTLDIQAGFGIAVLIDPTTRAQTPLIGTLFAYAAGAVFFAMDGHLELLRVMAASLDAVPIGAWAMPASLDRLAGFMGAVFGVGLGVAGAAITVLFAIDLAVAMLARTVPQMNALVLGFQVKTIALLLVLPLSFGVGGALILRMMRMTIDALPGLIG
jgi:flagellar biosynthetic protein FliR